MQLFLAVGLLVPLYLPHVGWHCVASTQARCRSSSRVVRMLWRLRPRQAHSQCHVLMHKPNNVQALTSHPVCYKVYGSVMGCLEISRFCCWNVVKEEPSSAPLGTSIVRLLLCFLSPFMSFCGPRLAFASALFEVLTDLQHSLRLCMLPLGPQSLIVAVSFCSVQWCRYLIVFMILTFCL